MLLFLHAWRNAGIAAIAIPASLCAAFATMWVLGFTINVLSLMGLGLILRRAYRGTVRDLLVTGGMAPLARCNDRCSHDFRALVAAARDGRDRDRVFAAGQPG
ncbi:MAG: efflux RND transporter permease subunit, partial [Vulcanimicrobiaceae bacterium]